MNIKEAAEKLGLEVIVISDPDAEVNGCYVGDLLSWVMGRAEADNIWITIMTNVNIIAVATLTGVSAIVVAEGLEISENITATARAQGVNLLRSKGSSFETSLAVGKLLGLV